MHCSLAGGAHATKVLLYHYTKSLDVLCIKFHLHEHYWSRAMIYWYLTLCNELNVSNYPTTVLL